MHIPVRKHANLEMRLIANSYLCIITGCWLWTGKRSKRNGGCFDGRITMRRNGKHISPRAHRVSYEEFKGPIPEGYEIDHTCRITLCINPAHLEAVPPAVNKKRRLYLGKPQK